MKLINLKNTDTKRIINYFLIGLANTFVTSIMIFLLYSINFSDQLANFCGICAGVTQSILLNSKFTFNQNKIRYDKSLYFFLILTLSYFVNLLVLNISLNYFLLSSLISQCIALFVYTSISFFLLNNYLFKNHKTKVE
jgi:putative flippase GtrA